MQSIVPLTPGPSPPRAEASKEQARTLGRALLRPAPACAKPEGQVSSEQPRGPSPPAGPCKDIRMRARLTRAPARSPSVRLELEPLESRLALSISAVPDTTTFPFSAVVEVDTDFHGQF